MKSLVSFTGIFLGIVTSVIMQTILATILPDVVQEIGESQLYSWVFSGYLITSTVTVPIFAKLADIYGRKIFYLGGLLIYLIGTLLSGTANSMSQLVTYRMIQGFGAGAVAPAAIAMVSDLFQVQVRGKMIGLLAAAQVFANVLGPIVGGLIYNGFGWKWAFWANIPVGILAAFLVNIGFKEPFKEKRKIKPGETDLLGGLLLGILAVLLIQGFNLIESKGILHVEAGVTLLAAAAVFGILLRQEKKHSDPVVSLDLIAMKNIKICLLSVFLLGAVMYGTIVVLPVYGRFLFGENAIQGGKLLMPLSMGLGIGGILSGRLVKRFSYAGFSVIGWVTVFLGFCLLNTGRIKVSYYSISVIVAMLGLGLGMLFPAFLVLSQNAVKENQRAIVGGLVQICRNLGGAIGVPLFLGFTTSTNSNIVSVGHHGYSALFFLLAIISLAGAVIGSGFRGSICKDQKDNQEANMH